MKQTPEQGLPKAFLDRLLDRVDPHQVQLYPVMPNAMLLGGRWIALRRLHLNLTVEDIVRRTRVDAGVFELIEAGQGYARDLQPDQILRLAKLLAPRRADHAWAGKVIALALGRTLPDMAAITQRVAQEVEAGAVVSVAAPPQQHEQGAELDPAVFAVLHAFAHLPVPQHSYGVAEFLFQKMLGIIRFNDATVLALIGRMQAEGLIERMGELRVDARVDAQPRPYYRMTALGKRVYHAAQVNPTAKIRQISLQF